ncbi:hypothetical protein FNF31_02199 [Cafeteria roenbergensis]|uniref:Uncharacterized protein n=1 Tax=Cafeteria roenbergensis TaxID=33653 RepID=A0A5A8DJP6_CAFRO|nr:hypothetical protein FNF31_02199 [Cafeteria roenbergensis]KAA0167243.1 hypothetical protein FNF28_02893 [Cafeteria roenbergensis]
MDGTPVSSLGTARHSGNHQMQSAFAPLAAAPTGVILPGVSAANPAPPSHLSPPRPAHGAGMSEAAMSAARPGPPRGAAADVESARAMATLSGLPADAPPEQYADAIRTAGAARLHELHRNAANVKLKTADGKNIWTLHEDEGVLGFVVAAIQRHRFTPAVPYVDWPWDTCSARHLGASRSAKQCRERWANVLNPFMKHDEPWTAAEMDLLIRLHGTFGNKWREIAKRCAGRSTNKVKNLFYSCERRIRRTHPSLKEGAPGYAAEIAKELSRVLAGQPKPRRHDEEAAASAVAHLPKIGQQASLRGPSGSFHQSGAAAPPGAQSQSGPGQQHAWPISGSTPPMGPGSVYGSSSDMYGTPFTGHGFVGSSAGGFPAPAAYGSSAGAYMGGWPGARSHGGFAPATPGYSPPSAGLVVVKTPAGPMRLMPDGSFVALPERGAVAEPPRAYAGSAGAEPFARGHVPVSASFSGGGFPTAGFGGSVYAAQQQQQQQQQQNHHHQMQMQMQAQMQMHHRQMQQQHGDLPSGARPSLAPPSVGGPPLPSAYDMRPAFHTAPGSAAAMHYYRSPSYLQPHPAGDAWNPTPARTVAPSASSAAAPAHASTASTAMTGSGASPAGFPPTSSGWPRPRAASYGLESLAQAAAVDAGPAPRVEASPPAPADASHGTATMSVDEEELGSGGVGSNISLHATQRGAAAARATRPLMGRSAAGTYGSSAGARLALVEATDDEGERRRSPGASSSRQAAPASGMPAAAAERSSKRQRSPRQSDGSHSARSAHSDTRHVHDPKRTCTKTTPRGGEDGSGKRTVAVGGTASMAATSAMRWPGVGLSASGMISQAVREPHPAAPRVCVPRADAGPMSGAFPTATSSSSSSSAAAAMGAAVADADDARPVIRAGARRQLHGTLVGGDGYDSGDDDEVPATSRSSGKRGDATAAGDSCGGFVVRNGRGGACEVVSLEEAIESMSV